MDRAGMLLLTLLPMGQGQSALYLKALSEFFFEFALWPLNLPCSEVVSPLAALITTPQDSQGSVTCRIQAPIPCSPSAMALRQPHVHTWAGSAWPI